MKIKSLFIIFVMLICVLASQNYHSTPDLEYDIHHSKIEISVDIKNKRVKGQVIHTLSPLSNAFRTLVLDCEETEVSRVEVMGGAELTFQLSESTLQINLDKRYKFDDTLAVKIEYESSPTMGLYFVHADSVYPEKHDQAWTQGELTENHHWVPLHDYPNDKATFETIITVNKPFIAVSNGELVSVNSTRKTNTFHWRENHPMVSYLISFAVGDYKKVEDKFDDLPVNYWVYPEHSKDDALRSFGKTPDMIRVFNEAFDYPYPYEKYDQVLIEDFMWGGMENITLSHQTDDTMHPESARPDHTSDGLVAHELAHQWFGNLLTTRNWANIWLNEGITSFSELIWVEAEKGKDEMEYYRYWEMKGMLAAAKYDPRPMVYYEYDNPNNMFNGNVYAKGAVIMHLLRDYLGDEAFYRGLRKYVKDNAYKNVETQDLKKSYEEATGKNLYWFFDQWAYKKGIPKLEVSYRYDRRNKRVVLQVKQTQNIQESSLFKLPVTVLLDDGNFARHKIFLDKAEDQFSFPSNQKPKMVIFDEGFITPKTLDFKKSLNELCYQLKNAPHVLDRVWAAIELGKGRPGKKASDALINAIAHDPFWGVRKEAAIALGKLKPRKGAEKILGLPEEADSRVLCERIKVLGFYKNNESSKEYLKHILESENRDFVLKAAFQTLLKVNEEEGEKWLDWALESNTYEDGLIRAAIQYIASKKDSASLERLIALAEYGGTTWEARGTAVSHLSRKVKDHPELMDTFVHLLKDPSRSVRGTAIRTVGRFGKKGHISVLSEIEEAFFEQSVNRAIKNLENPKNKSKRPRHP